MTSGNNAKVQLDLNFDAFQTSFACFGNVGRFCISSRIGVI
jgi:hypothetical protein